MGFGELEDSEWQRVERKTGTSMKYKVWRAALNLPAVSSFPPPPSPPAVAGIGKPGHGGEGADGAVPVGGENEKLLPDPVLGIDGMGPCVRFYSLWLWSQETREQGGKAWTSRPLNPLPLFCALAFGVLSRVALHLVANAHPLPFHPSLRKHFVSSCKK